MTKFSIISPDKEGRIDPPVYNILKHLNPVSYDECDVVIVPITRLGNYQFNYGLRAIKKPWVLVDFCEYGWDWDRQNTHKWGARDVVKNFEINFATDAWGKFNHFIAHKPPNIIFKRELLQKDVDAVYKPIEYPCFAGTPPTDTEEQFNARSLQVMHYWGHSHEGRVKLHGEMFLNQHLGYYLIDNFNNIQGAIEHESHHPLWASIYVPYFARIDINEVLHYNSMSKLSISFEGAGVKCFRHAESPINSIMVLRSDELAWSYPWVHGENCLRFNIGNSLREIKSEYIGLWYIEELKRFLSRTDLYEIYLRGLENLDKYRVERYMSEYIIPTIEKAL